MENKKLLKRIVLNPKIMAGKPIIQGTRITVDFILNLLAHGASESEILNVEQARNNLTEALELFFEHASESEIKERLQGEIFRHFPIRHALRSMPFATT